MPCPTTVHVFRAFALATALATATAPATATMTARCPHTDAPGHMPLPSRPHPCGPVPAQVPLPTCPSPKSSCVHNGMQ